MVYVPAASPRVFNYDDNTEIFYQMSSSIIPSLARRAMDDPTLNIRWVNNPTTIRIETEAFHGWTSLLNQRPRRVRSSPMHYEVAALQFQLVKVQPIRAFHIVRRLT